MNLITPSIKGNSNDVGRMKSWTRRLAVIELGSSYTTNEELLDVENRVFLEDPTLGSFLGGAAARLIYTKNFLLPFIRETTAEECGRILNDPPQTVQDATTEFVRKMAAGGTRDQESLILVPGEDPPVTEAQETLKMVHSKTPVGNVVREYQIRRVAELPGTTYKSKKGKKSKWEVFQELTGKFTHYFKVTSDTSARKLDIDVAKFEDIMALRGVAKFGGGYEHWGSLSLLISSIHALIQCHTISSDFAEGCSKKFLIVFRVVMTQIVLRNIGGRANLNRYHLGSRGPLASVRICSS